jgi:hypothetical protein
MLFLACDLERWAHHPVGFPANPRAIALLDSTCKATLSTEIQVRLQIYSLVMRSVAQVLCHVRSIHYLSRIEDILWIEDPFYFAESTV